MDSRGKKERPLPGSLNKKNVPTGFLEESRDARHLDERCSTREDVTVPLLYRKTEPRKKGEATNGCSGFDGRHRVKSFDSDRAAFLDPEARQGFPRPRPCYILDRPLTSLRSNWPI